MAVNIKRYNQYFEEEYKRSGDERKAHKYAYKKAQVGHKAAVKEARNYWNRIREQRRKGMKEQPKPKKKSEKKLKTTRTKQVEAKLKRAGLSQAQIDKLRGR